MKELSRANSPGCRHGWFPTRRTSAGSVSEHPSLTSPRARAGPGWGNPPPHTHTDTQPPTCPYLLEGLEPLLEPGGQHEVTAASQRGQLLPQVGVLAQRQLPETHVGSHGPPGPWAPRSLTGLGLIGPRDGAAAAPGKTVRVAGSARSVRGGPGALGAGPGPLAFHRLRRTHGRRVGEGGGALS